MINLAPAGSTDNHEVEEDEEEGHYGPRLGERDPHLGLGIVNFATKTDDVDHDDSFGKILRPNQSGRQWSSSNDRSDSSGKRGERF